VTFTSDSSVSVQTTAEAGLDWLLSFVDELRPVPFTTQVSARFSESADGPPTTIRRVDRKYVVTGEILRGALSSASQDLALITLDGHREQRYDTLYYDTPSLHSFHAARARRSQRSKVRVRRYDGNDMSYLEVKRRGRDGVTTKERSMWSGRFDVDATAFLRQHLATSFTTAVDVDRFVEQLTATGQTWYRRIALLHGDTVRITIDGDLKVGPPSHLSHRFPDRLILETKSMGAPTEFDQLLWSLGARPSTISKYALAIAASDPSQPTNRWTRYTRQLRSIDDL
jgi:VTC domain